MFVVANIDSLIIARCCEHVNSIARRVRICDHLFMGNPLLPEAIDAHVAATLNSALEKSGKSLRWLSRESGVKLTRLGDVLRRGRAITVGELDSLASALGLVGWKVMKEAEQANQPAPVSDLSERRHTVDLGQAAALDPGYSPEDEFDQ